MTHMKDAVRSGYWPLYRFSPSDADHGTPFHLDSKEPTIPGRGLRGHRRPGSPRWRGRIPTEPPSSARCCKPTPDERWRFYSQLATIERTIPHGPVAAVDAEDDAGDDEA